MMMDQKIFGDGTKIALNLLRVKLGLAVGLLGNAAPSVTDFF